MNLEFSRQILEKHSNMKETSWKSVELEPGFSMRAGGRTDGQTDRHDEAFCTFKNEPKNQSARFPPLEKYDTKPVSQNHC